MEKYCAWDMARVAIAFMADPTSGVEAAWQAASSPLANAEGVLLSSCTPMLLQRSASCKIKPKSARRGKTKRRAIRKQVGGRHVDMCVFLMTSDSQVKSSRGAFGLGTKLENLATPSVVGSFDVIPFPAFFPWGGGGNGGDAEVLRWCTYLMMGTRFTTQPLFTAYNLRPGA